MGLHDFTAHLKRDLTKFVASRKNHRHDDPAEIEADEVREKIRDENRFRSFAPPRDYNDAKWFVDGRDYFFALSLAFERAEHTIYILDWWLSPELFLRRPASRNEDWRIDRILKRAAERGVKIFVSVYKEVTQAMTLSSAHTKHALETLHPNITVQRHPDHNPLGRGLPGGDIIMYWAHHEKLVVIDHTITFIGGLDLCFGRWDFRNHSLSDVNPENLELDLWPGQDYNNARIMDFAEVDKWDENRLSKIEAARMPWHDVHCSLVGPVALDAAQHFVERWNFIKHDKYRLDERYPYLDLPSPGPDPNGQEIFMQGEEHPHLKILNDKAHRLSERFQHPFERHGAHMKTRAQILRSASDWSHGVLTENSIQECYCRVIREAEHFVYAENQFFIVGTGPESKPVENMVGRAIVDRIIRAHREGTEFRMMITIPEVPGFAGDLKQDSAEGTRAIMDFQYRSINRGNGHSIMELLEAEGINPHKYIGFYNLRSFDRINASGALRQQEEESGISYAQAEHAHAHEVMSEAMEGKTGGSGGGTGGNAMGLVGVDTSKGLKHRSITNKIRAKLHSIHLHKPPKPGDGTKGENKLVMDGEIRFEEGEAGMRRASTIREEFEKHANKEHENKIKSSIAEDALQSGINMKDEPWEGEDGSEVRSYVTEELYVHAKVLIADDRKVIIGSANLNDRSQLGTHDSEIAVFIEDGEMIDSKMAGKQYQVSKFATTLRRQLWREHLGLLPPEHVIRERKDEEHENEEKYKNMHPLPHHNHYDFHSEEDHVVKDPLDPDTQAYWQTRSEINREAFEEVFHTIPTDKVRNWADYDKYMPDPERSPLGHVYDPDIPVDMVKKHLSKVRGHVVTMPLTFLQDEVLVKKSRTFNAWTEPVYT
ncbi:hypothetical protein YB2330_004766 [Saitoella coloradoensis]